MAFAALKERRAARDARWRSPAPSASAKSSDGSQVCDTRTSCIPIHDSHHDPLPKTTSTHQHASEFFEPPELAHARIVSVSTTDRGRGLQLDPMAMTAKPGDQLLAVQPHVSVLSASQATLRCHFCFKSSASLQRCSRCKYAHYCGELCQRRAWTDARHREECAALQRWEAASLEAGRATVDPGAAVRALAQLVWQRKKQGTESAWWRGIASMQSHREDMASEQLSECAELAFRVAHFVSPEALPGYGFENARALLDMVCAYRTNSFALAEPQLDPIGVSISSVIARCNHSCEPNAVVVFPVSGDRIMRLVAIRPITPGEEILTSYVDLAETYEARQATLQKRYLFTCHCALCLCSARPAQGWTDPRTAFWCHAPHCTGWTAMPRWDTLPLEDSAIETGPCNQCGQKSTLEAGHAIHERWKAAERLMVQVQEAMHGVTPGTRLEELLPTMHWLSALVPPSNTILWSLMHAAHVLAIEQERFAEAAQLAFILCAGMQARGGASSQSTLYPSGHPVRAVLLATLGKLLVHETPPCPPLFPRAPTIPADRPVRLALAKQALVQALEESKTGFGNAVDGGDVAANIRDALHTLEQEQALLVQSL